MDLVRKWMWGAVMINNSMEDVASKFGDDWGRLAGDMPILAKVFEIFDFKNSNSKRVKRVKPLRTTPALTRPLPLP